MNPRFDASTMSQRQINLAIRLLVDTGGWELVRQHRELWKVVQKQRAEDRKYVDKYIDVG